VLVHVLAIFNVLFDWMSAGKLHRKWDLSSTCQVLLLPQDPGFTICGLVSA
jgi:hypothetical protein